MNSKREDFTNRLKYEIEAPHASYSSQILRDLGLLNLPQFIKARVSEDNHFLEVKIAEPHPGKDEFDENDPQNRHLTFRLSLKDNGLNGLYSHPLSSYIYSRYKKYISQYRKKLLEYSYSEAEFLQRKFPGLVFKIKVRQKSKPSYERKINQRIHDSKPLSVNDIIAERIIVYEYNGSKDEEMLSQVCYDIAESLDSFRQDTNFRIKEHDLTQSTARSDKPYLSKDYFENPKPNGYKSLHITVEDITDPDCSFETQVRTEQMEIDSKENSEQSHKTYKPRLFNEESLRRLPRYHEINNFNGGLEAKNPVPTEDTFEHYYQVPLNQFVNEFVKVNKAIDFKKVREKIQQRNRRKSKDSEEIEIA